MSSTFCILQKLRFEDIYKSMKKPSYIFDGRKILDHEYLSAIGFEVYTIGKRIDKPYRHANGNV